MTTAPHDTVRLILLNGRSHPWSTYYEEILLAEGIVGWKTVGLDEIQPAALEGASVVLLPPVRLTSQEIEYLKVAVTNGISLCVIDPSPELAKALGLVPVEEKEPDGYMVPVPEHGVSRGLACEPIQVFDRRMGFAQPEEGAPVDVVALGCEREGDATFPLVLAGSLGQGRFAAFGYDLVRTVLRLRQGVPEQGSLGERPDADGDGSYKPHDLFVGGTEPAKCELPQADEHQKFFVHLLHWLSEGGAPLVQLWYFPGPERAVVLLTGDSDGMSPEDLAIITGTIEEEGGRYTTYVMKTDLGALPAEDEARYRDRGHAFGPHGWAGSTTPDPADMESALEDVVERFVTTYGYTPGTYRGHTLTWVGWTEMAELLKGVGIGMECNFVPLSSGYGYLNGSGLPQRFMSPDGRLIDLFQQGTQWEDDVALVGYCGFSPLTMDRAIRMSEAFLERSKRFHSAVNFNFHPVHVRSSRLDIVPWVRAVAKKAADVGIPMLDMETWLEFNISRRGVEVTAIDATQEGWRWTVRAGCGSFGGTVLIPFRHGARCIADIRAGGTSFRFQTWTCHGVEYVPISLRIDAGEKQVIEVTYTSSGSS